MTYNERVKTFIDSTMFFSHTAPLSDNCNPFLGDSSRPQSRIPKLSQRGQNTDNLGGKPELALTFRISEAVNHFLMQHQH